MEETQPDVYKAILFIVIAGVAITLFLFIWKRESHPNARHKFRALSRQLWKIVLLLILIIILLVLLFDSTE